MKINMKRLLAIFLTAALVVMMGCKQDLEDADPTNNNNNGNNNGDNGGEVTGKEGAVEGDEYYLFKGGDIYDIDGSGDFMYSNPAPQVWPAGEGVDFASTERGHSGTKSFLFDTGAGVNADGVPYEAGWRGLALFYTPGIASKSLLRVKIWVYAEQDTTVTSWVGIKQSVEDVDVAGTGEDMPVAAGKWTEVSYDITRNDNGKVTSFVFTTPADVGRIWMDDVRVIEIK